MASPVWLEPVLERQAQVTMPTWVAGFPFGELLAPVTGLTCEARLEGGDVAGVVARAREQQGRIILALKIPDSAEQATEAKHFTPELRLINPAGDEVSKSRHPVRTDVHLIGRLVSQGPVATMMQDHQDLGNRTESGDEARDARDGSRLTGDENRSPLGRLAAGVTHRKSADGQAVISNSTLTESDFKPVDSAYTHIGGEHHQIALAIDQAVFLCERSLSLDAGLRGHVGFRLGEDDAGLGDRQQHRVGPPLAQQPQLVAAVRPDRHERPLGPGEAENLAVHHDLRRQLHDCALTRRRLYPLGPPGRRRPATRGE